MKKSSVILWIVAALFLVSSAPLFTQGNAAAGVCGIVIAAVLFYVGLRKKQAAAKEEAMPPEVARGGENKQAATPPAIREDSAPDSKYEFLRTKVAGVTFKNGRKSRQTILRKIYFKDEPFDKGDMELTLQRGEYEGKPAFGVFVNGDQIGNIPAEHTDFVSDNYSRCDGITHIDVYGGGEGRSYGAEIILRFAV